MAQHETLVELFTETANAIREKTEDTAKIVADNFPDAIRNIRTKGQSIAEAVVTLGTALSYTGVQQTQTIAKVTLEGTELQQSVDYEVYNNTGTNAGKYTLVIAGIDKYAGVVLKEWSIDRAVIDAVPTQSNSLSYTGSLQSPTWTGYDPKKMVLGGVVSSTDAGTFTATFTPTENYKWSGGETTAKSVQWKIAKIAGTISVSPTSVSILGAVNTTTTATITTSNTGAITASGGSSSIATASVSSKTVTVTAKGTGSTSFTITAEADTNHNAATCTLSATINVVSTTLNSNTWETIKKVSDANQGKNYWKEGDTKIITINGTVGAEKISSLSIQVFILGFNHNSSREGSGKIHFLIGKISGTLVSLVDSSYSSTTSATGKFTMNTSNTNAGGWEQSHMRKTVLGSTSKSASGSTLMAALPSDLRSVMKSVKKYTDNTGSGRDDASYVTSTTDYLWLLAEYEVFGSRSYANSAEQQYQMQYDYFKSGNGKIFNKHNKTNEACVVWLRSVLYNNSDYFCDISTGGTAHNYYARSSWGLAAAFAA